MPKELQVTLPLAEVLERYPDSNAFAFKLGEFKRVHFVLEDVTFLKQDSKFRSKVKCLIISPESGKLFISLVFIKISDTIIPLTNREFSDILKGYLNTNNKEIIENYALYGIKK